MNKIMFKENVWRHKTKNALFLRKPEDFSGAICPLILLEQFQQAVRTNVRLSVTFRVEFVVKKVPMQQVLSDCF